MPTPDYGQWLNEVWGWPNDEVIGFGLLQSAQNIAIGTNPPYSIADFLAIYPQFFGAPVLTTGLLVATSASVSQVPSSAGLAVGQLLTGAGVPGATLISAITPVPVNITGDTTLGSAGVLNVSSVAGLVAGMPISGAGIPAGTTILQVGTNTLILSANATATAATVALVVTSTTLTLSQAATASGTATLSVYVAPWVPLSVINAFIALASGSIMQARWQEIWLMGMQLYIAHYLTLWLRAAGTAPTSVAQLVAAGLARGIMVAKSADGLAMSFTPTPGLEDWGSYNLTEFGQIFATYAKAIGSGGMLIY